MPRKPQQKAPKLSAIERYRAAWKPDEAKIAEYKAGYEKAVREGDYVRMNVYWGAWHDAMRPPRHLPIKNWERAE